jgi:hypothetical protein
MSRLLLLLLIACAGLGLGTHGCILPVPPPGQPPEMLSGELRAVVPPPGSPFRTIGTDVIGRFQLRSAGGDVRTHPGIAILETPTGRIVATAVRVNEVSNVDALCDWMSAFALSGPLGGILPLSACTLEVFTNPDVFIGTTVSVLFAQQIANGDLCNSGNGFCIVLNGLFGKGLPAIDPNTATIPLHPGPGDGGPTSMVDKFDGFLDPEQQARLGCGPFLGNDCDFDGIQLFHAEAVALFRGEALARTGEGTPRRTVIGTGDVALPGGRDPFSYFSDPVGYRWDPGRDGCVVGLSNLDTWQPGYGTAVRNDLIASQGLMPSAADQCDLDPGDHAGNGLDGYQVPIPDALCPPFPFSWFDQTGDEFSVPEIEASFPTELAIVSENLSRLFDGITFAIEPACDPTTGCGVDGEYLAVTSVELADDPSGAPRFRWLWETGAQYVVTEATGDLAGFAGWTLHAFGPEVSRAGGDFGVPFLLADPSGDTAAPASSLTWTGDGDPGAAAYGVGRRWRPRRLH